MYDTIDTRLSRYQHIAPKKSSFTVLEQQSSLQPAAYLYNFALALSFPASASAIARSSRLRIFPAADFGMACIVKTPANVKESSTISARGG